MALDMGGIVCVTQIMAGRGSVVRSLLTHVAAPFKIRLCLVLSRCFIAWLPLNSPKESSMVSAPGPFVIPQTGSLLSHRGPPCQEPLAEVR